MTPTATDARLVAQWVATARADVAVLCMRLAREGLSPADWSGQVAGILDDLETGLSLHALRAWPVVDDAALWLADRLRAGRAQLGALTTKAAYLPEADLAALAAHLIPDLPTATQLAVQRPQNGRHGLTGRDGKAGARGPAGPPGDRGERGPEGPRGPQGAQGPAGPRGLQGDRGPAGPSGPTGPQGPPGEAGTDGKDGAAVLAGHGRPAATLGKVGDLYVDVETGDLWKRYADTWRKLGTLRGPQGDRGPVGPRGPRGPAGPGGVGVVVGGGSGSGTQGPAGPAGPAGPPGAPGTAATVDVGATTTGAAGTDAAVTNSGTTAAAVLDFTIPRGDTGATGATGPSLIPTSTAASPGIPTAGDADSGFYATAGGVVGIARDGAKVVEVDTTGVDVTGAVTASGGVSGGSPGAAGAFTVRKLGTGATDAAAGNDSRLSDARTPTGSAGGGLTGSYPDPTIATDAVDSAQIVAGAVGSSEIAAAIKDPAAATAGLRTLGTGGTQAAAGNDGRLSDSRTPTAHDIGGALHTGTLVVARFATGPGIVTPAMLENFSANQVLAGPSSGAAAAPTRRALVLADLPTVPEASVYHNANQSLITATWTLLAFNSERLDTDTIHDTATLNSRLVCKTAGRYLVWANIAFAANATGPRGLLILKNSGGSAVGGTLMAHISVSATPVGAGGTAVTGLTISRILLLNVNDYLEVSAYQESGGALNINATAEYSPEFGMRWLGA